MANSDNPLGFRLVEYPGGREAHIVEAPLTDNKTVYPGDLVKIASGKVLSITDADDDVHGVAIGYATRTTTGTEFVLIVDNPEDCYFQVQSNGATAATDIGDYYKPTVTTGDTTTLRSTQELDNSTNSATVGKAGTNLGRRWKLIDRVKDPNNAFGSANVDVVVKFYRNLDAA